MSDTLKLFELTDHDCLANKNTLYRFDDKLLCAGCFARQALRKYGKEAVFNEHGSLVMQDYTDLTHLDPNNEALILRKKLYQEYLDSKKNDCD